MPYTTDDVAKAARTTLRAIRLWDKRGLFGKVPRGDNGERLFTAENLRRATIISAASMSGMSLDEIAASSEGIISGRLMDAETFLGNVRAEIFLRRKEFDL